MRCTGCRIIFREEEEAREKKQRAGKYSGRGTRGYTYVRVVRHEIIGIAVDCLYSVHARGARLRLPKKSEPRVRDVSLTSGNTFLSRVIRAGW